MQNINMTLVDFRHLETFVLNSFLAMGLKKEDAKIFTDEYIELYTLNFQGNSLRYFQDIYDKLLS